jgi:Na+-transporting NADH:ubiquinone oxidoreductase subunit NqrF
MPRYLTLKRKNITFAFIKKCNSLTEVLTDHDLASLGDTYINFAYSLALSNQREKPSGTKVKGSVLAEALKKAELREHLPARMTRHMLADAAEALIVYAWLHNYITLGKTVAMLEKTGDPVEDFSQLLATIKNRVKFF